jgi:hypothetical protein
VNVCRAEDEQESLKPAVSWKKDEQEEQKPAEPALPSNAYVPPSVRRAQAAVGSMPTLSDAVKLTKTASVGKPPLASSPVPTASATGAPKRLVLITSAAKKAAEDEARKKEEERGAKEAEKAERREQLRLEMERTASKRETDTQSSDGGAVVAAPIGEVYRKYINRPKTGRKLE